MPDEGAALHAPGTPPTVWLQEEIVLTTALLVVLAGLGVALLRQTRRPGPSSSGRARPASPARTTRRSAGTDAAGALRAGLGLLLGAAPGGATADSRSTSGDCLALLEDGLVSALDHGLEVGSIGAFHPTSVTLTAPHDVAAVGKRRQSYLEDCGLQHLQANEPDVGWAALVRPRVRVEADDLPPGTVEFSYEYEPPTCVLPPTAPAGSSAAAPPLDLGRPLPQSTIADDVEVFAPSGHDRAEQAGIPTRPVPVHRALLHLDGRRVALDTSAPTTVGRSPDDGVVVADRRIDAQHVRLHPGPDWLLCDPSSRNGTEVNGRPVPRDVLWPLQAGDVVTMARAVSFRFELDTTASADATVRR